MNISSHLPPLPTPLSQPEPHVSPTIPPNMSSEWDAPFPQVSPKVPKTNTFEHDRKTTPRKWKT